MLFRLFPKINQSAVAHRTSSKSQHLNSELEVNCFFRFVVFFHVQFESVSSTMDIVLDCCDPHVLPQNEHIMMDSTCRRVYYTCSYSAIRMKGEGNYSNVTQVIVWARRFRICRYSPTPSPACPLLILFYFKSSICPSSQAARWVYFYTYGAT
jgi:hypothetical protein